MLDFSWGHILIVLIVALIVVGPKDLPRLMRAAGQWAGKARHMLAQFRKNFDLMARESELDELRKEIQNLRNEGPLANPKRETNSSVQAKGSNSKPPVQAEVAPDDARAAPDQQRVPPGSFKPSTP